MVNLQQQVKTEVFHPDFNLDKKDNLGELPREPAIFGVFAIVNEEPINCRYIGYTPDLRAGIRDLFENPPGEGMKKFMQGAWIQLLVYEPVGALSPEEQKTLVDEWNKAHNPKVDEEGEYPGYYDY